ncbi:MAG: hypothetical protein GY832_36820 [Chloroflexi bacterium]|nr:hypothetical protein [Chloroflexota bacterium]
MFGPVSGVSLADLLSGAESVTLPQEAQQTPDGLGSANLDGLQFADPAAQIDLVQPPSANNQGDAQIIHPLSVPPGRAGLQPDLSLTYSSSGGNGWVGLGWDLSVGEVTIDTRWGVPRYDSGKETETYILDGEILSPTAVRSTLLDRVSDRVFQRRIEGEYEYIKRHGSGPGSYWWEVIDKEGTHRYYGGTPEGGPDPDSILADDNGNGFRWALKQIRDISNNTATFNYTTEDGEGVGANGDTMGRELYLESILYTGTVANGPDAEPYDDPAYEVEFVRASQLGESTRPDVSIDARGGFLRVTSDLLREVNIYHRDSLTRKYVLNYSEEAFSKTMLDNVTQAGSDGLEFARHTFTYYDDVRDGSTYNGFATSADWDTGADNVTAGLDIPIVAEADSDDASALGATELIGGGARLYLGYNQFKAGKDGSIGGGIVGGEDKGESRLELLDINGDNLPDKVFEEGDVVKYRLNTSGPDGGTTFGAKGTVANLDKLSREESMFFGVGPEAYFGISLMYNHAWSRAWGRAYFIDVNTDGLVDFVNNGTVYYNSLDGGVPTFITDDSQTGVPIDAASISSYILPDFSAIEDAMREQAPLQDTVRRWEAPWSGDITIQGNVELLPPTGDDPASDGVRVAIQHNGTERWSTVMTTPSAAQSPSNVSGFSVNAGDRIYFRVQSLDDGASDAVSWDPLITYDGTSATLDANGLDVYSYQASEDFTLAGRTGMVTSMPVTGVVQLTGDFNKAFKTSDDITIQVFKNGVAEGTPTIVGKNQTGNSSVDTSFNVVKDDEVMLQLKIDSPVDLAAFSWTPRLFYLSATQDGEAVNVTDKDDNYIFDLNPPVNTQIYPGADLTAPQVTWTAPNTNTIPVIAAGIVFCDPNPSLPPGCFPPLDEAGFVVVTVKKKITPQAVGDPPAELVAKQILTIEGGVVKGSNPPGILTLTPEAAGEEYWFDLSVAQPGLGLAWLSGTILGLPSARHWAFIPDDVFPMPYRGWGYAGYNGNGGLATSAIVENNLKFDTSDYPTSEPTLLDPSNETPSYPADVDPGYKNPTQGKAFAYAPLAEVDGGTVTQQWRGSKDNLYGAAASASSSRVGPDSVDFPDASDLGGARAVTRLSVTEADAVALGFGGFIGGSYAWGTSEGRLDFFDMNGDEFPDIIGDGGVQYTTVRGGLEYTRTKLSGLSGNIREDSTVGFTGDSGGTVAKISADSKGDGNTSQDVSASSDASERSSSANGDTGSADSGDDALSVEFGISGSIGRSSTNTNIDSPANNLIEKELADVNGDGLPDLIRIYRDDSLVPNLSMTVAFNLGYGFSTEVAWPGGSLEQGESFSRGLGASLGFSTSNREFGGGVSLNASTERSLTTWVDLNGDGLIDQLKVKGDEVKVRFGAGAGLTSEVDWGDFPKHKVGAENDETIALNESTSLGAGFDFTISIGPLCIGGCYIIINPGGDGEGGMSRQEVELNDVNGDGYPDQLESKKDNLMKVAINTTRRTNLLQSVTNPLSGTITLDYEREGNTTSQAFSQWVLSSVAVDDGRSGDGPDVRLTTYDYADNVYHALERDFLGYATVTEHQRDADTNDILRSYHRVYKNSNIFESGLLESETLLWPDGTTKEKKTVNTWNFVDATSGNVVNLNPDPAGVGLLELNVFPQLVKTEDLRYDNGTLAKQTWNTFAYDTLGNVIEVMDEGEDEGEVNPSGDDVIAYTTYTNCPASWVSIPQTFVVEDGSGTVLRSRSAENDGNEMCDNGVITTLYQDTGNGVIAQTDFDFDDWGNYDQITYPENENGQRYQVNYVYDEDRRTDVAKVTDSFGLVGEATYHNPTGQIASQTDANGQTTSYTYDLQGRLASITGPYEKSSGYASVTFEYYPTDDDYAYAIAQHYDVFHSIGTPDTIDTVSFLDGIGRETQTKQDATVFRGPDTPAEDVMIVGGAVEFDALGRAVKEWYPIEEPLGTIGTYNTNADTDAPPTLTSWDIQDRVTKITAPDGSTTATSYGFAQFGGVTMFLNTRTDPEGNVRRSYIDIRDNLLAISVDHETSTLNISTNRNTSRTPVQTSTMVAAVESDSTHTTYLPLIVADSDSAAAKKQQPATGITRLVGPVETLQTSYIYDPLQQLVQVVDPDGNVTTHEYDRLGRRTATTTPDGGRVELFYDPASQVIAKVTPNLRAAGGQISYAYDFNRLEGISYSDGTPSVTYEYGGTGASHNGVGRIVCVLDGAREQFREFGLLGEVTKETTTMLVHNLNDNTEERLTWTTSFAFETWGRPKTVTYPDGELVSYGYDSGGLNASVAGNKAGVAYPYILRQEYDKFLARRFQKTGNGVETETSYDSQTRRLNHITTDAPGRPVQDITYTYDLVGNVLTADNEAPAPKPNLMGGTSQQTFVYDDLYQLISADGTYNFAPRKHRDYTFDLAYDNLGNIIQKSQTDRVFNNPKKGIEQHKTTYDQLYDYNAAPHQPTHIGHQSYTYDASGNLTGWTDDNSGQNRTVTWDAEDRVTSVANQGSTTRYTYDDEDRLAIERGPSGETSFVNRFYPVRNGSVAWKHFWAGADRIATKRQMPNDVFEHMLYFLHKNLLGSTDLVTDPNGHVFEYVQYFPGGETWVLEHGDIHRTPYLYAGGYYDEFRELYNFGARWYEPREQLFYSPDPILVRSPRVVLGDPALLTAYSYAENNPLRLVDRDGLDGDDVQKDRQGSLSQPNGSLDQPKGRVIKALVQQKAGDQASENASRLDTQTPANSTDSKKSKFEAFATLSAPPVVEINLKPTSDGLKLKNVKLFGVDTSKIKTFFKRAKK